MTRQWTEAERSARLDKLLARNRAQHEGAFLYEDAGWMRAAYVDRGLTLRQMADEAECSLRTIARWMEKHEIPTDRRRIGEHLRARGQAHPSWKGGPPTCPTCGEPRSWNATLCRACYVPPSGEDNPNWRGGRAEYTGIHYRLIAQRGEPGLLPCQHCCGIAAEWAYDHQDPDERYNERGRSDGPYSVKLEHYIPLCVPCHRRFDSPKASWRAR